MSFICSHTRYSTEISAVIEALARGMLTARCPVCQLWGLTSSTSAEELAQAHAEYQTIIDSWKVQMSWIETRPSRDVFIEERVMLWILDRLGIEQADRTNRALRMSEEVTELCQSEGILLSQILSQVLHVYSRPSGDPNQEAGGVAVCLFGWCAATGNQLEDIVRRELERITKLTLDRIRGSLSRKADADLVVLDPKVELYYIQHKGYCGNSLYWWATDGHGYTCDLRRAWKLPKERARSMCASRPKEDFPRLASEVDQYIELHISCERTKWPTSSNEN